MPYRNAESRFALNPTNVSMKRSRFNRPQKHITSFNAGDVVPFYIDDVLPGDTFNVKTSYVVRLQPLVNPIMDDIYLDTYYFFVPSRLVWDHWKNFMGENSDSAWIPEVEYSEPQIESPEAGWAAGTIADYFGIPTNVGGLSVSALPFRAYALIMNEFFRDQNLTDPLNIPLDDSTQTGTNGTDYINDVANGGMPFKASKYHDYFTSSLPSPQKGPDVTINLAGLSDTIPVYGNGYNLGLTDGTNLKGLQFSSSNSTNRFVGGNGAYGALSPAVNGSGSGSANDGTGYGVPTKTQLGDNLDYSGLIADLSNVAGESIITIDQLRSAFQIQKFYEAEARGGSRYIEILKSMFGVTSPDSRLQRPEYLGGKRQTIAIQQVVQTSETNTTPQGNTAAYSVTSDSDGSFVHSFTEHGYVIGLMVARYDHTYQQGIERMWSRKSRYDYYWPLFAHLSEQEVLFKEIYAQGSAVVDDDTNVPFDDEVFGYQERYAEYRYKPNRVSGEMRSNYATSLDSWHLADFYSDLPALSDDWIREDSGNIDRALAVTSRVSNQFIADIYVQNISTRCMPVFGLPGLSTF